MRIQRIFGHAALLFCCACEASETGADAAEGGDDAHALDEAGTGPTALDAAEAQDAEPAADAATPAPDAADDGDADACASCNTQECSETLPCSAPDTVCVEHTCQPDPQAPAGGWQRTTWSGRVGLVADDDTTLWCTPTTDARASGARVASAFQIAALDGTQREAVVSARAAQRVRVQCFADATLTGPSSVVTSAWSTDADGDVARAQCPEQRPHAGFVRCQIAAEGKPPFVYAGASCGDGVAGVSAPSVRGQLLGDHYELEGAVKPLFNDTGAAAVMGTDLGFQFLSRGRMYLGFGDTWENEFSIPGPNGYRGSKRPVFTRRAGRSTVTSVQAQRGSIASTASCTSWACAPIRPAIRSASRGCAPRSPRCWTISSTSTGRATTGSAPIRRMNTRWRASKTPPPTWCRAAPPRIRGRSSR